MSPVQVQRMHELPKYVLSSRLRHTHWHNAHALGDDPAGAIARLKQEDGGDLALFTTRLHAEGAVELALAAT